MKELETRRDELIKESIVEVSDLTLQKGCLCPHPLINRTVVTLYAWHYFAKM